MQFLICILHQQRVLLKNLLNSGIKEGILNAGMDNSYQDGRRIYKTGNTVIDALLYTGEKDFDLSYLGLREDLKTILLTSHRREKFWQTVRKHL